jgi:CubicO group peptidase (beta-lactamase class C family)
MKIPRLLLTATLLAASTLTAQAADTLAHPATCPDGVAAGSRCLSGRDSQGAYYWFAVPPDWTGTLVVHAHGGPELGEPKADRVPLDLTRWSVWTRAGFAYAGSGFHQGGVAVRSAAEDVERVRRLFIAQIGAPKRTVLHGQSWGASVAAKAAELTATSVNGRSPYDAVLLTSGVLGGGSQSYDFRFDLRVIYQAVCHNHPRADEPPYPLWQGLPLTAKLTRAQLADRVDECTGVRKPASARSAQQARNLATILAAVPIVESALISHLNWGTWHFQDIVFNRLGGRNPFDNQTVRYTGSPDDAALNAQVFRAAADPAARAAFAADADLQGRIPVPVISVHAVNDPTAFVELEDTFRKTMQRGGSGERLVQLFTDDADHSYLSDAQYVTAIRALLDWAGGAPKPTPTTIAARCASVEPAFEPSKGCRFLPDFTPRTLDARRRGTGNPHGAEPIGSVRQMYDGALSPELAINTFRNIDRIFPVRVVAHGAQVRPLASAATPLGALTFTDRGTTVDLEQYLDRNRVAGLLVLKDGRVALERYRYGNTERTRWMSMSVAKSITSTLIGAAIKDGRLSLADPVTKFVPVLAGSSYDGVTVRDILMMSSGVKWNETYTDSSSDRRHLLEAQLSQTAGSAMRVMRALPRAAAPGTKNTYSTGETQVATEVLRSAIGRSLSTYLSEKIWKPYGMEGDATWWLESPDGTEIGGSGFSATLRDYARFGQFILDGGRIDSRPVLPDGWTQEATSPKTLRDGSALNYGYFWWPGTTESDKREGGYRANGIFGQHIYINPTTRVVIVVWGAQTRPSGGAVVNDWAFFNAVSAALR